MVESMINANFPMDAQGRVYHMGVKKGEVANHILTVGDPVRAQAIAQWLDDPEVAGHPTFVHQSHRGFLTITGRYKQVPVSIMAIGMGNPMMDFFVRETRAVTEGPLAIIRYGSCGSLSDKAPPGSVMVPRGGYCVRRNIDYFCSNPHEQASKDKPYLISGIFDADPDMTASLKAHIASALQQLTTTERVGPVMADGWNADGCSFFSSQGRSDPNFKDHNEELLQHCLQAHPQTYSIEMETSMLFHLAACCTSEIRAAACMHVIADRLSNEFIQPKVVALLEPLIGKAALDALVETKIPNTLSETGTVWDRLPPKDSAQCL